MWTKAELEDIQVEDHDLVVDETDDEASQECKVEAITTHQPVKGKIHYEVKWVGYDETDKTFKK